MRSTNAWYLLTYLLTYLWPSFLLPVCRTSSLPPNCGPPLPPVTLLTKMHLFRRSYPGLNLLTVPPLCGPWSNCLLLSPRWDRLIDWLTDWIWLCCYSKTCSSTRLDYCNAVLVSLPASTLAPLPRVLHAAACIVLNFETRDHVTCSFELHWLPVHYVTLH